MSKTQEDKSTDEVRRSTRVQMQNQLAKDVAKRFWQQQGDLTKRLKDCKITVQETDDEESLREIMVDLSMTKVDFNCTYDELKSVLNPVPNEIQLAYTSLDSTFRKITNLLADKVLTTEEEDENHSTENSNDTADHESEHIPEI
jgi:hypothetical protein